MSHKLPFYLITSILSYIKLGQLKKDYGLLFFKICHVIMIEAQFEDINFLFTRASFVVMKMKLTLHLYIVLYVQLICAQSVLKLLILQRHQQNTDECLQLINLMRKPCALSIRYMPLSLFAWKKAVKLAHLCAVSAKNMENTKVTRYDYNQTG